MTFHTDEVAGSIHIIHNYEYADETARLAATGFVSADIGKVARQLDNNSWFILTATTPTWAAITGTLPSGGSFLGSFDANDATFPASDPAVAASRNGHPILVFDDATDEFVVFSGVMSTDYTAGDIDVNIDWVAETATTGDVIWGIEVERLNAGGPDIDSDGFATIQTVTDTTSGTSGVITRTTDTLTNSEADSLVAGDAFRIRISRDANAGGDTMTDDAQILQVSLEQ